ncbi:MAG: MBL fold metallo-hydrolase [Chloroflexi bacterium]|nr:MBL fold metallo-hydrolase [Chloroflexota bacterium]
MTASLILSNGTGVLIDTMLFPSEAARIALHVRQHCPNGVRYIIYTGHEADHTYGAFLFPRAEIIAHEKARDMILERGPAALAQAREALPEMAPVMLRPPTITFSGGSFTLRLPGKTLEIMHMPGHTSDGCSVLLHEERILFAGDAIMALPTVVNGDPVELKQTIERAAAMQLEYIVQGHGELILRGEIKDTLKRSVGYLDNLTQKVQRVVDIGGSRDDVRAITIESCGLTRVLLNGAVGQLHISNALALYDRYIHDRPAGMRSIVEEADVVAKPAGRVGAKAKPRKAEKAEKHEKPGDVAIVQPETAALPKPAAGRRTIHAPVTPPSSRGSRTV